MKAKAGIWQLKGCSMMLILATMACSFAVRAQQAPEPIRMPDVRANIMKMLQQGKGRAGEREEDLFAEAARQKSTEEQASEQAKPEEDKPVAQSVMPLPQQTGEPVELPIKEILIKDVDDLKKLAQELEKAKKRQAGE